MARSEAIYCAEVDLGWIRSNNIKIGKRGTSLDDWTECAVNDAYCSHPCDCSVRGIPTIVGNAVMDRREALMAAVIVVLLVSGFIQSNEIRIMIGVAAFTLSLMYGFLTVRRRVGPRTKMRLNVLGIAVLVVAGLLVMWLGAMSGIYWGRSEKRCVMDSKGCKP
jgi:hypothetical protein